MDLPPMRNRRQRSEPLEEPRSLIPLLQGPPALSLPGWGRGTGQRAGRRCREVTRCSMEQWEQSDLAVGSSAKACFSPLAELRQPEAAAYKS